jgi:hypothetical protein
MCGESRHNYRKTELVRAVKGICEAGLTVTRIRIDRDGINIETAAGQTASAPKRRGRPFEAQAQTTDTTATQ